MKPKRERQSKTPKQIRAEKTGQTCYYVRSFTSGNAEPLKLSKCAHSQRTLTRALNSDRPYQKAHLRTCRKLDFSFLFVPLIKQAR